MKYVLYGHGGAYNHGAEAIIQTTLQGIRSLRNVESIALLSHFPEQDKEFHICPDLFLERDMMYVTKEKEDVQKGSPAGIYDYEIYRSTIEAMDANTVALSVGGDNYCYPAWHRWKTIHEEAKSRGAKDILWSCSINPESINESMKQTLASHDLIAARESITYQALKSIGLNNVIQCADVAFLLESKQVSLPEKFIPQQTVALNVSPLVMRRENQKGLVMRVMLSLLKYIFESTKMQVALIPHVVMPMDNDYAALKELYTICKELGYANRVCLCSDTLSAAEYKYIISQCRFGVFSRTHASIAAYSTGVPALVLGYSVKAQGIARDLEMQEYVLDICQLYNEEELVSKFVHLMEKEADVKHNLQLAQPVMRKRAEGLFDFLK